MAFGAASAVWAVFYGLAGAIVGSFVAALVLRWLSDRSVMAGRSVCDHCGGTLRVWELVPILSFVALAAAARGAESRSIRCIGE